MRRVFALESSGNRRADSVQDDKANGIINHAAEGAVGCDGAVEEEDRELDEAQSYAVRQAVDVPSDESASKRGFELWAFVLSNG